MGYNNLQQIPPLEIDIQHPLEEIKEAMKLVYKFSYRNSYTPVSQNEDFGIYKFRYGGGTKYGIMMGAEVTVTVTKASDATTKINITSLNRSASVTGGGVDVASRYISDRQDGFLSGLAKALKSSDDMTLADFNNEKAVEEKSSGCLVAIIIGLGVSFSFLFS